MAPVIRGNSLYTIVDGPSWTQAEANSVKLGGHLVTINDASENEWLRAIVPDDSISGYGGAWIGLSDEVQEGQWRWSSGINSIFTNWSPGQPGNDWGGQDYALMGRGGTWDDANPQPDNRSQHQAGGIAEIPFIRRGDSAYVIVQGPTWEEAEANAVKLGGHLVTINDAAENKWLRSIFKNQHQWIGLKWNGVEWVWSSGEKFGYSNWWKGSPQNLDDPRIRGVLGNATYWYENYGWEFTGIAEIKLGLKPDIKGIAEIRTHIDDQQVKIYIDSFGDQDNPDGFNQQLSFAIETSMQEDGNWTEVGNGKISDLVGTYTLKGNEFGKFIRARIDYIDFNGTADSLYSSNYEFEQKQLGKTTFKRYDESLYIEVKAASWNVADAIAKMLGGNLVTIDNSSEEQWLSQNYRDYHWIGLNYKNNSWSWSSGSALEYTNWLPGGDVDIEGSAAVKSIDGKWYSYPKDEPLNRLDDLKAIVEINKPNNKPTGTPTLSGTFKAGQIITIDKTPIQDADNFTGYTTTYNYSWESSTNGTTWTPLSTTDATDNNTSFTLTTAEVGKQVRGVVSYLDGYGTQESVPSKGYSIQIGNQSPIDTDYSNDPKNPTPINWSGTVTPYQGLISNSVGPSDKADYLTFKVLPNQKLTGITLTSYNSTDGKAFIGLQSGAQVTASKENPQPLIGYTHFGSGQADAVVGTNLISKLGGVLNEGTYSIWIQQLGAKTDYSFDLDLEDNPTIFEPRAIVLPASATGTKVTIADTSSLDVIATSQSSPDLIEIQAPVNAMLNALTTETHSLGFVARNVGTKTTAGTGQMIPLRGLGKYTFVATAIPEATTTINLETDKDTAFFLHDAYSAFYEGLTLTADSSGRQSHQRVLNVDTIYMGSGGGTSIVDLTSKDYVTGAVTVYGADQGRSIFWGTDANDIYISRGGDSVIFGGAGSNSATLGTGRDTLQYRAGVGAIDRIEGFDRTKDAVELWIGKDMVTIEPQFSSLNGSTLMQWGGNTVEFVGIADLTLSNLKVINRFA